MKRIILIRTVCLLVLAAGCGGAVAQRRCGLAYYALDGLYDTVPSLFYDDRHYTPAGRLAWDGGRYRLAVERIAAVLDSMAMPLVGLCGVENEAVVRDLVAGCSEPYCYLHRTTEAFDGLDPVLLYYGDRFLPDRVEQGRGYLSVVGRLDGVAVAIVLCRESRFADELIAELREEDASRRIFAAGRLDGVDGDGYGLEDPLRRDERLGRGNVRRRGGWRMRDRILADSACRVEASGVYLRRFLLDRSGAEPLPIFRKERYRGGTSSALPVFVYFAVR